jgi:hypothetical protein
VVSRHLYPAAWVQQMQKKVQHKMKKNMITCSELTEINFVEGVSE